ncbi:hypothetical protein FHY13_001482 [Xanthomonas arboricola]|uniref:hypothetical protein n=1 Tax=Xanthomonas euroxanthea TaxID=2259622 RepID=UPI001610B3F5|nr:hypothetical protein [Xanthomonas euroxanthea]MBB3813176.1 hypothetical protein [Xanthomonas euroxanthea]
MTGREFEAQVLAVARMLWSFNPSSGAENIEGRERDGIFHEEDVIHLIEATIDKSEEKAKQDCRKLSRLAGDIRKKNEDKVVKCWFITKHEPTDRQRTAAKSFGYPVHAVSFNQFQSKLIDATEYISARKLHKFGSVHSPSDQPGEIDFVAVDLKERNSTSTWRVAEISQKLEAGETVSLTADYGAGKSMIFREVFRLLSRKYLDGKSSKFPVHINLREHSGAQFPDEILERHARIIGFSSTTQLVRAWRAGYVILLLDGFDEITSLGFQGRWSRLQELRFKGLQAVREMIFQQPADVGLAVAGREYYFDSHAELIKCLGLKSALEVTLNDFTQEQVDKLLINSGVPTAVTPAWLPKRPLFVATLALRGHLAGLQSLESSVGEGWNELIHRICERESRISGQLDSLTIRGVLERVATISRGIDGDSILSRKNLTNAFIDICGYEPDEQGILLLERLPGLGVPTSGTESRAFVDQDFECALGAAEVAKFYLEPWNSDSEVERTVRPLSAIGIAVAKAILKCDPRSKNAQPALERANPSSALRLDILQTGIALEACFTSNIDIRDLHALEVDLSGDVNLSGLIYFNECIIDNLYIDPSSSLCLKSRLQGCLIRTISGVHSRGDIPDLFDENCMAEEFVDKVRTNADILEADIPLPVRVLLVIIRKLFLQSGRARKENAFYRGLDTNAQRYVSEVLDILISEGLTSKDKNGGEPLYIRNRHEAARMSKILAAPETSLDPLLIRVRSLA